MLFYHIELADFKLLSIFYFIHDKCQPLSGRIVSGLEI